MSRAGLVIYRMFDQVLFIMSIQRSILGFVKPTSAISNQSKETQAESSRSVEVSRNGNRLAIDMSGTSGANLEFSSERAAQ